jgi:hypothetical protein
MSNTIHAKKMHKERMAGNNNNTQEGVRLKIEIIGCNCSKCNELDEAVRKVSDDMGHKAAIHRESSNCGVVRSGVTQTPALKINGKNKCQGRVPSPEEIRGWISEESKA